MHRFAALAAILFATQAFAQGSPVGLWKTFDEDSGAPKSLVRIQDRGGVLQGRVERLLDPDDAPNAVCEACTDERRNQPVLGMVILRNAKKSDSQAGRWDGGDILDPENGKVYGARLTLSPDGRRLDVRGFIGTPLLGRTQAWQRVE